MWNTGKTRKTLLPSGFFALLRLGKDRGKHKEKLWTKCGKQIFDLIFSVQKSFFGDFFGISTEKMIFPQDRTQNLSVEKTKFSEKFFHRRLLSDFFPQTAIFAFPQADFSPRAQDLRWFYKLFHSLSTVFHRVFHRWGKPCGKLLFFPQKGQFFKGIPLSFLIRGFPFSVRSFPRQSASRTAPFARWSYKKP